MRVLILTCNRKGFGAYCLPRLAEAQGVDISMIIYSEGARKDWKKYFKRKLRKTIKIGPLGALNGIRMRSWFKEGVREYLDIKDIKKQSEKYGIRYESTPSINCQRTIRLFQEADAKLGLSLGNGYISEAVFSIPKHGMINVHHEKLPEFQGAQSVIWQIYQESNVTGYTIHQIDKNIDSGEIIYSDEMPIDFKESLKDTVSYNYAKLYEESSGGLVDVLGDFSTYWENSEPQLGGRSYTTPSFWQYLKMVYNHRKLAQRQGEA